MDELLSEFLIESQKRLAALDAQLGALPRNPGDGSIQKQILDFLHTIKGASVLLGLRRLEALAQAAEDVLVKARSKSIVLSSEHAMLMLDAIEAIRRIQRAVATGGQEPAGDDTALLADLKAVAAGKPIARAKAAPEPQPEPQPAPPPVALEAPVERPAPPVVRQPSAVPSISIPIERIAHISGLVGELVTTRNSLAYVLRERLDPELEEPLQRLDYVTSDLSAAFMATRRQALGEAAPELPDSFDIQRVISVACGEQHFAIPQRSVLELVRVVPGARRIASDEVRLLRLRERKHPWVRLASLLKIAEQPKSPGTREIVVMMDGADGPFGLAVDRVYDAEEVVVRPLPPVLRRTPLLTGTTLLGDGSVALVLDSKAVASEVPRHRIAPGAEPIRQQLEVRS
jgi:chemotaxis protein histidine kinase CheA